MTRPEKGIEALEEALGEVDVIFLNLPAQIARESRSQYLPGGG